MENHFPIPAHEALDATIKKKPKEDPVRLFLERFGKVLDIEHAASDKIDVSYLTPAQRAESMWAVFQDIKHGLVKIDKDKFSQPEEKNRLRMQLGILKNFYDDTEAREQYEQQHQRHIDEVESINGNLGKYKKLERETREAEKTVDGCAREMFAKRGSGISEVDKLIFETNKQRLWQDRKKMEGLVEADPELAGLAQYHKLKEYTEQLKKENFIWTPSRRKILDEMEEAAMSGKPVLLSGESGTGKTRLVEQASLKLTGQICNLTPGKDTRFQDLIAKPKISTGGQTYYEYKEIGEAATGRSTTLEEGISHQGRIVADDEFNLRPESDQTEMLARISSWTPDKNVRMPVTNREEKIAPNFLYCAMVNLASERYARKKIPPEVLRKFAKVGVGYPEQSEDNPEIYEMMLASLMDENGRIRAAYGEITPAYEEREEARSARKDGQEVKQTVRLRELISQTEDGGHISAAGGFLWRLAGALNEINKSFSRKETILKSKGEAQFIKDLIIDIGTIAGWLKEYQTFGREKSLEGFFSDKMQKEFLSREAYSIEDRKLVKEFLSSFNINVESSDDNTKEKPEFEIMTPLEIGLLSPRVKYEKVVSEEPVLSESYRLNEKGEKLEFRIEPYMENGKAILQPNQIYKDGDGKIYQYLGIGKKDGGIISDGPLANNELEKLGLVRKKKVERKEASSILQAKWKNPENGVEKAIEINFENFLAEQKLFYKNNLNIEINEAEVRSVWQKNYAEIKKEIETYGYNTAIIVPSDLPGEAELNGKIIESMLNVTGTYQDSNISSGGSFVGVKNTEGSKYRIILTKEEQNMNKTDDPLLKATRNQNIFQLTGLDEKIVKNMIDKGQPLPINFETTINKKKIKIKAEGLSLSEYMLFQRMYFDKNKKHLDEDGWTWLTKSLAGSRVVGAYWNGAARRLAVRAGDPGDANSILGVRLSRSFSS